MSQLDSSTNNRGLKFTVFLLGLALPIAGAVIWSSKKVKRSAKRVHDDELQLVAVEDSFPASDPPASW